VEAGARPEVKTGNLANWQTFIQGEFPMADVNLEKATFIDSCLRAAAQTVAAQVAANGGMIDGVKVGCTSKITDPGQQAMNILVYETAKVLYWAGIAAFHDESGVWPDPQEPVKTTPTAPASTPAAPVSQIPSVAAGLTGAIVKAVTGAAA
jgi:hypothetical protein